MFAFGAGKLIAVPQFDSQGTLIANPTPVLLGAMQDVSLDISVDLKMLYAAKRFPIAVGQGKGKIELKAKYADINGGVIGSLFYGKLPTAGIKGLVSDFAASVPAASTYTITVAPPSAGTFVSDAGVWDAATGVQLTRVASAPATGQYSVSVAGVYTFALADASRAVLLNYEYSAVSTTAQTFNLTNDLMGFTPSFSILMRQQTPDGKTLTVKFNRAVSGKLALPFKSDDFTVSDFEASVFADNADNIGWMCLQ
ncbi:MAG TPA: hypothetical protein VLC92_01165 [Rhodocyclaceae bacterium]|nr:hypothetical protein [Rhodocyclaceae bacterium]